MWKIGGDFGNKMQVFQVAYLPEPVSTQATAELR